MRIMWVVLFVLTVMTAHAQQENYTLLLMEFENQSGIDNPLLNSFNDTMSFVLSRQAEGVQVRVIPSADRDALLTRAANTQPDATPLDQALLATELIDADALVTGSYTKQGDLWLMAAQVYHRKGESKARQEIAIQDEAVYGLLDAFPAQLLPQFTGAGSVAITTDSWKAYEEFRKGHEQFEGYNFFGALEHYDRALQLDPTLALAYAEQSYVYFMTGQPELATKAIQTAQEWLPSASPVEQAAIRILGYGWDSELNTYAINEVINLAPGGVWDEVFIHQTIADIQRENAQQVQANQHDQRWFEAIQSRIRAHPEDASLLHDAAVRCLGIDQYITEAIEMELKAIQLNPEEHKNGKRYILSQLYQLRGDTQSMLEWARKSVQHLTDPSSWDNPHGYDDRWYYIGNLAHEGLLTPKRGLSWCQDVLRIPDLPLCYSTRTQYLAAQLHHILNDEAQMEAALTSLGAPHEGDWMVLGPFETSAEKPLPDVPPFDLCTDLTKSYATAVGDMVTWQPWQDDAPLDGLLDLRKLIEEGHAGKLDVRSDFLVVYSCIYVGVPSHSEAQIRTGSGMMKCWLNEDPVPVIYEEARKAYIVDAKASPAFLDAGPNRILVATASGTRPLSFYFRITDLDGNAIPGLKYVSLKDALASGP